MLGGVTRQMLPHLSGVPHLQALSWYFRWWRVAVRGRNGEIHDWLSQFAIELILLDNVNKKNWRSRLSEDESAKFVTT